MSALALSAWVVIIFALVVVHHKARKHQKRCAHDAWTLRRGHWECDACGETVAYEVLGPRPLWRWALFSAALWLSWHTGWEWAGRLMSWAVLPEWLGWDGELLPEPRGEGVPF